MYLVIPSTLYSILPYLWFQFSWKLIIAPSICSKVLSLCIFVNKCLRRILKIFWPQSITNADLYARTETEPLIVTIKRRKWRWIGRTLRKPVTSIVRPNKIVKLYLYFLSIMATYSTVYNHLCFFVCVRVATRIWTISEKPGENIMDYLFYEFRMSIF